MKHPYHSAIKGRNSIVSNVEDVESFTIGKSVAMYWDIAIEKKLPSVYLACDVMYTEIAWSSGLKNFNERAGVDNTLQDYYSGLVSIIEEAHCPVLIVCGKKDMAKLPKPNQIIDVKIHNGNSWACVYKGFYDFRGETTEQLIEFVRDKHSVIGDFCCGYGNVGRTFAEIGKSFIMSDYNKKCIGYIKSYYENRI